MRLSCYLCSRPYDPSTLQTLCECGRPLRVDHDLSPATLDRSELAHRPPTMWRYRPLLPIDPSTAVEGLDVGGSPLHAAPRLARALGLREVWVKDEGRLPTGSLKDRASAMAASIAVQASRIIRGMYSMRGSFRRNISTRAEIMSLLHGHARSA